MALPDSTPLDIPGAELVNVSTALGLSDDDSFWFQNISRVNIHYVSLPTAQTDNLPDPTAENFTVGNYVGPGAWSPRLNQRTGKTFYMWAVSDATLMANGL